MIVSINLLTPGVKVKFGQSVYLIEEVHYQDGLTRILYKNARGVMRSKSYNSNDKVKIV